MHDDISDSTDTRDLLWTSGWDSTFRLLSALLLENATVTPHYVADEGRASTEAELRAMKQIREAIAEQYPAAYGRLLPTRFSQRADVESSGGRDRTARRYANLAASDPLGAQYEWLARYAASAGLVDLELSIHFDDKAHKFLEGNVVPIRTRSTTVYRLTEEAAKTDLALFERFSFPLFDLTKLDMQRVAEESGFIDILEMSWFCHSPLAGQPCGTCGPCNDAVREGVGHRLPPISRLRNRINRVLPLRLIASKARQLLQAGGTLRPGGSVRTGSAAGERGAPTPTSVRSTAVRPPSVRSTAVRPAPQTEGGIH